jgi:hypothetical protein
MDNIKIIAIDANGKKIGGVKTVSNDYWNRLLKFGKNLRWVKIEEIKDEVKTKKHGRKERSGIGIAVKKVK